MIPGALSAGELDAASAYVRRHGDDLAQARLRCALGEPLLPADAERVLAAYQFVDGSWDYAAQGAERIGSLGGTIHCLRWVRELGLARSAPLADSALLTRTLSFLAAVQDADGSFYETPAKLAHSPQPWLQVDTLLDRFFLTAAAPLRLAALGRAAHPLVRPALAWLSARWHDWRLVTGTWYSLWALLGLHRAGLGPDEALHQRCVAAALAWLPEVDAQPLTWLLDALLAPGGVAGSLAADEPLVSAALDRLWTLRGPLGWPADAPDVETTVTALRLWRAVAGRWRQRL